MSQPDGFYTYTIIVHGEEKGILWEGEINARPFKTNAGTPALEFKEHEIPKDLAKILRENSMVNIEWSESWEVIDTKHPERQIEEDS